MGIHLNMKTLIKIKNQKVIDCFKNKNKITCKLENGELVYGKNERPIAYCDCGTIYNIKSSNKLYQLFNYKKYNCLTCCKIGINNPFFGKKHSDKFKKRLSEERKGNWCIGEKNGMYNKSNYDVWIEKYGKDVAEEKQRKSNEKNKNSNLGTKNHFYGKHHKKTSITKITNANLVYKEKNKDFLTKKGMDTLNITDDTLKNILNDYCNNPNNRNSIQIKYNIDFRTIESYWLKRSLISKEKLKEIKRYKKFLGNRDLNKFVSKPEYDLYEKLKELHGESNVKSSFIIPNTSVIYDICLFDKVLIEYDGYYWHKIRKSKNDSYKTNLAKENKYVLYRVEENKNRNINLTIELNVINSILKENKLI